MSEPEKKVIEIPEICRVEGHSAVTVDIENGKVVDVRLDVFEGTRFFEQIVVGHKYDQMPHITSRVCAICSTGHVLAAVRAIEAAIGFKVSRITNLYRELMHLGMIIESHSTHICALALPDFLKVGTLYEFASKYQAEFAIWTSLRNLGSLIQTCIGGRPFHPVNLQVGGLSHYASAAELAPLKVALESNLENAEILCQLLLDLKLPIDRTCQASYLALIPDDERYGYMGDRVKSSDGWEAPVSSYKDYLVEKVVSHSHAKRSHVHGKPVMVGSIARLMFYSGRLKARAKAIYDQSPLAQGNHNTILNNLAQAIELMEAMERSLEIIDTLGNQGAGEKLPDLRSELKAGQGVGTVECPRGTLYHYYELDSTGQINKADMITPSAQNTARIEQDIAFVVDQYPDKESEILQSHLETLVRAYDPCNTCATHMVKVRHLN